MSKTTNAAAVRSAHRHDPEAGVITVIGMIRDAFNERGRKAELTSKDLPLIAEETGFDETTVRLQFYRWRKEGETDVARAHYAAHMERKAAREAKRAAANSDASVQ